MLTGRLKGADLPKVDDQKVRMAIVELIFLFNKSNNIY
jgi:hypothetical protein